MRRIYISSFGFLYIDLNYIFSVKIEKIQNIKIIVNTNLKINIKTTLSAFAHLHFNNINIIILQKFF